jgi:hypothetical protein
MPVASFQNSREDAQETRPCFTQRRRDRRAPTGAEHRQTIAHGVSRGSRVRKDHQPQRGDRHGRLPCTDTSREDAKTRRREGGKALFHAGSRGSPRGKSDVSRRRFHALPTPTALRPRAQGWPRNEDNPGFAPSALTNRIAVVAPTEPNSEAPSSATTSEPNPFSRDLAQRRRGAEEDRERDSLDAAG